MTRLLVVETSPRGDSSVSRRMTRRFVERWKATHPDGEVVTRDLVTTGLEFVTAPWLRAYFTPPDRHPPAMKAALALSDELTAELLATDHLLIATPVYNYNVPAPLKAWVDHVVRKGMTLGFDGEGLVENVAATVLIASGGVYTEGSPIRDRDLAPQYLKMILGVIGIDDVTVVAGGNAKSVDMGERTMDGFVEDLAPEIDAAAAA